MDSELGVTVADSSIRSKMPGCRQVASVVKFWKIIDGSSSRRKLGCKRVDGASSRRKLGCKRIDGASSR
jgi:hypothetical protein